MVVLTPFRHSFVWTTGSRKLEEVIASLEAACGFFGDARRYPVIDNVLTVVAGADALHTRLTLGFLQYSSPTDRIHLSLATSPPTPPGFVL